MEVETIQREAQAISAQFPDEGSPEVAAVASRLELLVGEYQVPIDEARRSVTNHFIDVLDLEYADLAIDRGTPDEPVPLVEVTTSGDWITVEATVVQLWDPRSDAIAQVGLLGDESGTLKFTKWTKSELPPLEEGTVYRFENVVTDEYQGRFSVNLNRRTEIERVDVDIDVGDNEVAVEGALVAVLPGSGLIKRCPEEACSRVLRNGRCSEHGDVEGAFDLRLKTVIDDGHTAHDVLFDADATEALTGMGLDEATQLAMDALDTSAVADELTPRVLGRYYRVAGPAVGRYILAREAEPPVKIESADILETARAHA